MIKNFVIDSSKKHYVGGGTEVTVFTVRIPECRETVYVSINEDGTMVTTRNFIEEAAERDLTSEEFDHGTLLVVDYNNFEEVELREYFKVAYSCYIEYLQDNGHNVTIEFDEAYSPTHDITFILETVLIDGSLTTQEAVGWYHGEPNDVDTEYYGKRADTMAFFDL